MRLINAGSTVDQPAGDHGRTFTWANMITVVRFLGIPVFVALVLWWQQYLWAVLLLAALAGTDWVDGYVARRFNQTSRLGRALDPLADRATLVVVALTLVLAGIVPWWFLAILIVPDAVLLIASLVLFRWHPDLPVSVIGKLRTAALLVGAPLMLLAAAIGRVPNPLSYLAWTLLTLGLIGHVIAAGNYLVAMVRKHRSSEASEGRR